MATFHFLILTGPLLQGQAQTLQNISGATLANILTNFYRDLISLTSEMCWRLFLKALWSCFFYFVHCRSGIQRNGGCGMNKILLNNFLTVGSLFDDLSWPFCAELYLVKDHLVSIWEIEQKSQFLWDRSQSSLVWRKQIDAWVKVGTWSAPVHPTPLLLTVEESPAAETPPFSSRRRSLEPTEGSSVFPWSNGAQPPEHFDPLIQSLVLWWSPVIKLFCCYFMTWNVASVMDHNVDTPVLSGFLGVPSGPKGVTADRLRTTALALGGIFFFWSREIKSQKLCFTLIGALLISAKGKIEDIKNKSSSAGEQNEWRYSSLVK